MCGFVGDAIGGVVKAIGSVAKAVVKNALPILETVALTAVLGPAGLGLSKLTASVISRVAVTALNGGSLLDVATAGLTPMLPSIGKALGVNLDASGFISKSVSNLLGNSTLASVVAGAIGEGTTAGVMAAITGGDVLKAATFAGLNNVLLDKLINRDNQDYDLNQEVKQEPKIINDLPKVDFEDEGDIEYTPEQIKEMEEAEKKAEEFRRAKEGE